MKIVINNGSLTFKQAAEYVTIPLTADNCTSGKFIRYDGTGFYEQNKKAYSDLFEYNGGDIELTHADDQWYAQCIFCFYTADKADSIHEFKKVGGPGTSSTNGLEAYVVSGNQDDRTYRIPEADIKALGDIKYFRIGGLQIAKFGITEVTYKR